MAADLCALGFKAVAGDGDQLIESVENPLPVAGVEVSEAGTVDRDDADRSGLLGGSEEPVSALEELGEVQLEPAAHRADHVRVKV